MKNLLAVLLLASACGSSTPTTNEDGTMTQQKSLDGHGHGEHHGEHHGQGEHKHVHSFDDPEKYAERWNSAERAEWQKPDEVLAFMQISPGQSVADLGAGTGYFVPFLSAAVGPEGKVYPLDVEDAMLAWITKNAADQGLTNVEPRKAPFDSTGMEDGSLDRLLTVNTWHHIENRKDYAKRLFAVIKPGGRVVVVDFTKDAPEGPPPEMRLDASVVIEELQAGGFDAALVEETLPRQYIVVGTKK
ncbi:MAG: methyltransferase domain-containing protein [bacterium]